VFTLPSLHWAGVEQWLLSLVAAFRRIDATAVPAVALTGDCDADLLAQLKSLCEVRQGDTCRELISEADAAVVWSLNSIPWWLSGFDGQVIGVSHGMGDWWMQNAAPWIDRWVAVANAATIPCPGSATVLHNGCDVERLRPTLDRQPSRESLGLRHGDIGVGILARLSVEKRHEEAISRWHLLPDNYRLVIVGDGSRSAELRTLATTLGNRVVWAGVRHDIGNVYNGLDVTLSLSSHEGYGLSVVESVLAGLPTVATPVGIVPELPRLLSGRQPVDVLPQLDELPSVLMAAVERGRRDASGLEYLTADAMARRWADYLSEV
jgi:glycosyltransferase involved in cell wall biosynthesis